MRVDNHTLVVVAALAVAGVALGVAAGPGASGAAHQAQAASQQAQAASQQAQANVTASVQFDDQTSNGSVVSVANVTLPEGGYVAVYNDTGTLLGSSEYLENGTATDVTVELVREATADGSTTLIAIAHRDTNANRVFDFPVGGATSDTPYVRFDGIVLDVASVQVEGPPAEETPTPTPGEETPGEETPTPTPGEETPEEETPTPTPGVETPEEETPEEETPGEETPGEETPGEETPGEETPTPTPGA